MASFTEEGDDVGHSRDVCQNLTQAPRDYDKPGGELVDGELPTQGRRCQNLTDSDRFDAVRMLPSTAEPDTFPLQQGGL